MKAQHVSICKCNGIRYVQCEVSGHPIRVFNPNIQMAILSGQDVSFSYHDVPLTGIYKKGV